MSDGLAEYAARAVMTFDISGIVKTTPEKISFQRPIEAPNMKELTGEPYGACTENMLLTTRSIKAIAFQAMKEQLGPVAVIKKECFVQEYRTIQTTEMTGELLRVTIFDWSFIVAAFAAIMISRGWSFFWKHYLLGKMLSLRKYDR